MQDIELRDLLGYLKQYPKVDTLLFTGGNSKNGPEYFFRKHIKNTGIDYKVVSNEAPRIHEFDYAGRTIRTVSLISPSGSANRSIGSLQLYKDSKAKNSQYNTIDYRVEQYRKFF